MGVVSEFREFAARGNVVDLAVGVIMGTAFGKIVTSLVDQVIMPPLGLIVGRVDFAKLQWVLRPDDVATAANELTAIQYGAFLNTLLQFLLMAVAVFLLVKAINRLRAREAAIDAPPAAPTPTELLLTEIRDELRSARTL